MNLYIFPFYSDTNQYIEKTKIILKRKYNVKELPPPTSLKKLFVILLYNKIDIVTLNWFEDNACSKGVVKFFIYVLYLLILRVKTKKIIWIRHNIAPHDKRNKIGYRLVCSILSYISNKKVTHRPIPGYDYVPHINYIPSALDDVCDKERTNEYLIFGQIKAYKGIVDFLKRWPEDKRLLLVGRCHDSELERKIVGIIEERNLNIRYQNKFLSDDELNLLLMSTKTVILTHFDDSMIVSGGFYHASSYGCNILVTPNKFSDFLVSKFTFVNYIENEGELVSPNQVIKELLLESSDCSVFNYYSKLLES